MCKVGDGNMCLQQFYTHCWKKTQPKLDQDGLLVLAG